MPHAGKIGAEGRAAELVERSRKRTLRCSRHDRLKLRQYALAIGLSERHKACAGGYPVRDNRVKKRVNGRRERYAMRCADKADRDRIDNGSFTRCDQPIQRFGIPRGSRYLDKRPALGRGFKMTLARGHKSRSKPGGFRKQGTIASRRGAVDVHQKDRIANSGAVHQHRRQPLPQRCRVRDVAGFYRPLDTTGIRERPDRKRRREPCHQPVEARGFAFRQFSPIGRRLGLL